MCRLAAGSRWVTAPAAVVPALVWVGGPAEVLAQDQDLVAVKEDPGSVADEAQAKAQDRCRIDHRNSRRTS
jgi:hypothetical protein